jgi:hypothetical protein
VTDQPPRDEPAADLPAALGPDGAPTEVTAPEPPAAFAAATPDQPAETPAPVAPPTEERSAPQPPPVVTPPAAAAVPPVPPPPTRDADSPGAGAVTATDFPPAGDGGGSPFPADRPEIAVGAAFAGGFVLALILKRLAR